MMSAKVIRTGALLLSFVAFGSVAHAAVSGNFVAILDQRSTNINGLPGVATQKTVLFYNVNNLSTPLFGVYVGNERTDNLEDPSGISVNPNNGDVYLTSFDNVGPTNTVGEVDSGAIPAGGGPNQGDTDGDTDLYRVNFQQAYDHWNTHGQTYATYYDFGGAPSTFTGFTLAHPNQVSLPGVYSKVGEVARSYSPTAPFYSERPAFVDDKTIVMLDSNDGTTNYTTGDHQVRVLNQVSPSPNSANWNGVSAIGSEGGFNRGTTQSWESKILGQLNMDGASPSGFSKPVGLAYTKQAGVEGIWVLEDDGDGDDVQFFQFHRNGSNVIDSMAPRPLNIGGGPAFPTKFKLDNDPIGSPGAADGNGDWIGVDNTGNLLISESGHFNTPVTDPKMMKLSITSYDTSGRINLGAWSVTPLNIPTDDETDDTDGRNVFYDSAHNAVYYMDLDFAAATEAQPFFRDLYKLNLNTGVTTTVTMDHNDFAFFGNQSVQDQVMGFFHLSAGATNGDYDDNGVVDAADIDILWHMVRGTGSDPGGDDTGDLNGDGVVNEDDVDLELASKLTAGAGRHYGDADLVGGVGPDDFTAWRIGGTGWAHGDFDGTGDVGPDDFTLWRTAPTSHPGQVGPRPGESLAAVPEPAAIVLLALGLPALVASGRRSSRRT